MQLLKKNMGWSIKNQIPANSTNAQHGAFCYADWRIYPHRPYRYQLVRTEQIISTKEYNFSFSNSIGPLLRRVVIQGH
jgi:hypothetical protein